MDHLLLTRFQRVSDVSITPPVNVSWESLVASLTTFRKVENKKAVGGWSPAMFRPVCTCGEEECPGAKGHRKYDNVLEVYALALDIDKDCNDDPLDQAGADHALGRLRELGLRHVVHTTYSHKPDAVSLRAVIAISRPVARLEYAAFWSAAIAHLGIQVETKCCNPDRFWFSPSCPPDRDGWAESNDGVPLDVDAMLAAAKPAEPAPSKPNHSRDWSKNEGQFDREAFLALVSRHDPSAKEQRRRDRIRFDIECPWEGEHSSSSRKDTTVSWTDDGRPEFSCLHSHCKHRHWQEFRAYLDPEYAAFRANGFKPTSGYTRTNSSPNPIDGTSPPLDEETLKFAARDDEPRQADHVPFLDSVNNATDTGETKAEEWPVPQPLDKHSQPLLPVEEFCVDLLPMDLKGWVHDIAHRMSVPIDLPAVAAMCALSIVATNARTIQPKRKDSWRVYPVLWGGAIAPPGSKKTPATNQAFELLDALDLRSRAEFMAGAKGRETTELLLATEISALKDLLKQARKKQNVEKVDELTAELTAALEKEAEVVKPRRYVTQDATIEKITDIVGNGTKRRSYPLGVKCDELIGFFHMFDRDGREGDRAFYLEGWSVATRAVDRVQRGSVICRDLALIVFGNMTPEPFEAYVREAAGGAGADGLLQRFQMLVYPDRMPPGPVIDEYANEDEKRRARRVFERLAALDEEDGDGKPPALRFTEEAQEFYFEWQRKHDADLAAADEHVSLRSHFAKYSSLMPAIALICHLADGAGTENRPVTLWAAQQAAGWCEYLRSHARRIYALAGSGARVTAQKIITRIKLGGLSGEVNVRELYRSMSIEKEAGIAGLELLEDLGWVRLSQRKTNGRPSLWVAINPRRPN